MMDFKKNRYSKVLAKIFLPANAAISGTEKKSQTALQHVQPQHTQQTHFSRLHTASAVLILPKTTTWGSPPPKTAAKSPTTPATSHGPPQPQHPPSATVS